jgi:hypothetical protein
LSYTFARRPLERIGPLQCGPWAAGQRRSGQPPAGAGRARAGEGPWVPGDRFPCSVAEGEGPAKWTPAARRGGRRCLLYQRGGALQVGRARLRARLGAREGGEHLVLVRNRPELVARRGGSDGGHGGEQGGGLARFRGAATPLWQPARLPATDGPTVMLLGVSAGLGRSERQGRHGTDRRSVERSPAGRRAARGGGGDFEVVLGRVWPRGTSLRKARGGSDVEAAYDARAGALARWSAGDVASAWNCFGLALFER